MSVMYLKTKEEYDAILQLSKEKLVVIEFTASWCGPCRYIGPIFEKMADGADNRDVVKFVKVDVDKAEFDVSGTRGVSAFPTFQFFKSGKKVEEIRGANVEKLTASIKELRVEGVTKTRDSKFQEFCDACLCGDVASVRQYLKTNPEFATSPTPLEWHNNHIMRSGWQPVDSSLNPGVLNAAGTVLLNSNHPSYVLHLASGNGHSEIVKMLLDEGRVELEATDGDADTALNWATYCGRKEVMEQLLAAGADSSFADTLSRRQYEAIKGDGDCLEYLQSMRNKA